MRDERIDVTVEKAVLTDSRDDLEFFIVEVVRDDVREQAGGVDDPLGADDAAVLGADGEHAVFEDDAADVEGAKEFDTVADCAFGCADGQFIGGDDAFQSINGQTAGTGTGRSKKEAEQAAARNALDEMKK